MNRVLLFSGGLDSYIAYHYLKKPKTVYFDTNNRYSKREVAVVKSMIPETVIDKCIDFSKIEVGDNAYIPFRNLVFATQAVRYADTVYIAGIAGDNVSDKNEEVFTKMSALLSEMEQRTIQILSPFWEMEKEEIVRWYCENVGSVFDLQETISCYSSTEKTNYCGSCPSCFRKWVALSANGLVLPFFNKSLMLAYLNKAKKNEYTKKRNESTIKQVQAYCSRY